MDELTYRAVNVDSKDPSAWYTRAGALGYQWRWNSAIEASDQELKLDPTRDAALDRRAELKLFMGQPTEALKLVDQALALDPSNVVAIGWPMEIRCRAYVMLDRYEEAMAPCEKAASLDDYWVPHAYLLAAYTHQGETAKADAEKATLLKRRPGVSIADFRALKLSDVPASSAADRRARLCGLAQGRDSREVRNRTPSCSCARKLGPADLANDQMAAVCCSAKSASVCLFSARQAAMGRVQA